MQLGSVHLEIPSSKPTEPKGSVQCSSAACTCSSPSELPYSAALCLCLLHTKIEDLLSLYVVFLHSCKTSFCMPAALKCAVTASVQFQRPQHTSAGREQSPPTGDPCSGACPLLVASSRAPSLQAAKVVVVFCLEVCMWWHGCQRCASSPPAPAPCRRQMRSRRRCRTAAGPPACKEECGRRRNVGG